MLVSIHKPVIKVLLILIVPLLGRTQTWTLERCIDSALNRNKNYFIQEAQYQVSLEKWKENKKALYPKVFWNNEYKYYSELPTQLLPLSVFNGPEGQFKEAQFGVPHTINSQLQLQMPLFQSSLYSTIQVSKIYSEMSELQKMKTKEQLFFEVSTAYYQTQSLMIQLSFLDSTLIQNNTLIHIVEKLYAQGMAKKTDLDKLSLQINQIKNNIKQVQNQLEQSLNRLKFIMGLPIDFPLEIETKIHIELNIENTKNIPIELRILQTQKNILSKEITTIKRNRYPSLFLFASYGYNGFAYDKSPNEFLRFYPVGMSGVQLQIPIFQSGILQSKIKQKKWESTAIELKEQLFNEQQTMLLHNADLQLNAVKEQMLFQETQIQYANSIYEQTVLYHQQGLATLTEVLLAENSKREIQQLYVQSLIQYQKTLVEKKKIIGIY